MNINSYKVKGKKNIYMSNIKRECFQCTKTLENTEGAIKDGKSRESCNKTTINTTQFELDPTNEVYVAYASVRVVVLIERLVYVAYASVRLVILIKRLVYVAYTSVRLVVLIERLVYVAYTFVRVVVY
jgi:hypothetical protein